MQPRRPTPERSVKIQHIAAAATCVLLTSAGPAAATVPPRATSPAHATSAAPAYFHTLKPGTKLPAGAQCARWVLARPAAENKGMNRRFSAATGQQVVIEEARPEAQRLRLRFVDGEGRR